MNRFSRFAARTALFAGLACSALFAPTAFAERVQAESVTTIAVLEQREVELKAEIAQLNARIDALDAEITTLVLEASALANQLMRTPVADTDRNVDRAQLIAEEPVEQIADILAEVNMARQLVVIQMRLETLAAQRALLDANLTAAKAALPRDDTLGGPRKARNTQGPPAGVAESKKDVRTMPVPPNATVSVSGSEVALVGVATFTAASPAEGWAAWKRQSHAWKKAHPWEGPKGVWCTNSARLNIPCTEAAWKKVPAGTLFLLPAPDVRVYVPQGVEAPKAIAVVPGESAETFKLDLSTPVTPTPEKAVSKTDVATVVPQNNDTRWTPEFIIFAAALVAFALALLWMLMSTAFRRHRRRDEDIATKGRESECCAPAASTHTHAEHDAGGCCKTDSTDATACGGKSTESGCCKTGDAESSACSAPSEQAGLTPDDGKKPKSS